MTNNIKHRLLKLISGKPVLPAFWFKSRNFGDQLTRELLKYYGYYPVLAKPSDAAFMGIGSILQDVPDCYRGVILGSGFIRESARTVFKDANVIALRGELTKENAGIKTDIVLADPGLLVSEIYRPVAKKHLLGIVPHYVDAKLPIIQQIRKLAPERILVIDVMRDPLAVCRDITSCEYIISSSLHGLIVSDSFGVPNRWLSLSTRVGGEGFKFRDYYSAFGESRTPLDTGFLSGASLDDILNQTVSISSTELIAQKKAQLAELFSSLDKYLDIS